MATTKTCPKCSESILLDAKRCKHCQADLRSWFVRHKILSGVLGFFGFLIVVSALNSENAPSPSSTTAEDVEENQTVSVTANQLYQEYSDNQIAADTKYKDQWLEVSGTVQNIGKDVLDSMYVSLHTANPFGSVQCMLEDSELEVASTLKEGQSITVIGKNSGMLLNVVLRQCTIK